MHQWSQVYLSGKISRGSPLRNCTAVFCDTCKHGDIHGIRVHTPATRYHCRYWLGFSVLSRTTANFQLPDEGVLFDKVEFIELQRDEAQPLVEKYNKEGRAAQPPDTKRFRGNDSRDRYSSGSRFSTFTLLLREFFSLYIYRLSHSCFCNGPCIKPEHRSRPGA